VKLYDSYTYRTIKQPYLGNLYTWLQSEKNLKIDTLDVDPLANATHTLDISAKNFPNIGKYNVVLACNILEHVRWESFPYAVANIASVTEKYLVITSPLFYIWHFQPIDNGWRPTPEEIADVFKNNFRVVKAASWKDEHYVEPYISMPHYAKPRVSGVILECLENSNR